MPAPKKLLAPLNEEVRKMLIDLKMLYDWPKEINSWKHRQVFSKPSIVKIANNTIVLSNKKKLFLFSIERRANTIYASPGEARSIKVEIEGKRRKLRASPAGEWILYYDKNKVCVFSLEKHISRTVDITPARLLVDNKDTVLKNKNSECHNWKFAKYCIDDEGKWFGQIGDHLCHSNGWAYSLSSKPKSLCGCTGNGKYSLFKTEGELHAYSNLKGPLIMKHKKLEKIFPYHSLALTIGRDKVKLWEVARAKLLMEVTHPKVCCAALNERKGYLVTADSDKTLKFWDSRSSELIIAYDMPVHYGSPLALAFDQENEQEKLLVLSQKRLIWLSMNMYTFNKIDSVKEFIAMVKKRG